MQTADVSPPGLTPDKIPQPLVKDRMELLKLLDLTDGVGVEVGVAAGWYSTAILNHTKLAKLYSIDRWDRPVGTPLDAAHTSTIELYAEALDRLSQFGGRSQCIRLPSDEAVTLFADASMDFVYIDADHNYEGVLKDIQIWYPKVKPNGVFAGHDYAGNCPGVMRAVDEFFRDNKLPLYLTECDEVNMWSIRSWFTVKPIPAPVAA